MKSIYSITPDDLIAQCPSIKITHARKLISYCFRHGHYPDKIIPNITKETYELVKNTYADTHFEIVEKVESTVDTFIKYAFKSYDGSIIESVRIPLENPNRFVVCVSSQVGCAMNCSFCGTAKMGFIRNLEPWEITEQIRVIASELPKGTRVHGIVFQGMGEPLHNVDNVLQAIKVIMDPCCLSVDARNITISTSGISKNLDRVFNEAPNVRLGISIGSAIIEKRKTLLPVEKSFPLMDSIEKLAKQAFKTKISPMFAYATLQGINDTEEDMNAFHNLLNKFIELAGGIKPRVSLINYNRLSEDDPLQPVTDEKFLEIRNKIASFNVPVIRRYSGGYDIEAACGQLGLKHGNKNKT